MAEQRSVRWNNETGTHGRSFLSVDPTRHRNPPIPKHGAAVDWTKESCSSWQWLKNHLSRLAMEAQRRTPSEELHAKCIPTPMWVSQVQQVQQVQVLAAVDA